MTDDAAFSDYKIWQKFGRVMYRADRIKVGLAFIKDRWFERTGTGGDAARLPLSNENPAPIATPFVYPIYYQRHAVAVAAAAALFKKYF